MSSLKNYIKTSDSFKNSINIYLDLNKPQKVTNYIPTKSSISILDEYIESVNENKDQATILIGPYGKGKSHLLLVLLSILSMERTAENRDIVNTLLKSVEKVSAKAVKSIETAWNKGRFLPVIVSNSQMELSQSFTLALNEALKREGLEEITPSTYYSKALEAVEMWESDFIETFDKLRDKLESRGFKIDDFKFKLKSCDKKALDIFKDIYPYLTSGSEFNPLVNTEILPLFRNIKDILKEDYGYSGIYIVFDEFSKFIESKSGSSTGNDMKLIQDMCELAQDSKGSQLHMTMVAHKSIKEYGDYLSRDIINSFTGIEGRITEKLFITSTKNNYELIQNAIEKKESIFKEKSDIKIYTSDEVAKKYYSETPIFKSIFNYEDFKSTLVKGCYPMNPLAAYMLLNISEKVAQNERTLFTFISKNDQNSLARYILNHKENDSWIVGADLIYDYFKSIFKKDISSESAHEEWLKAEYAISKCNSKEQERVIKSLALINIINKPEEVPPNSRVLGNSVNLCNIEEVLNELVENKLIYYKKAKAKYVFKTSIGADLKKEIKSRRVVKGDKANISQTLGEISDNRYVLPKRYNQEYSITRYFKYEFVEAKLFLSTSSSDIFFEKHEFCDGKVIALVDTTDFNYSDEDIKNHLQKLKDERLVVLNTNEKFKKVKQVQDYEVIKKLKIDQSFIENNRVLEAELQVFEEDIALEIREFIDNNYSDNKYKSIYYVESGKVLESSSDTINKVVSKICENYYGETPVINNELINRRQITSPPIKKARKGIIEYILGGSDDESFYSKTNPEATIFRATLVNTGVLSDYSRASKEMRNVIDIIDEFLLSCELEKKAIKDLIVKLVSPPIAIREGVIPIYIAYVMSRRKGDVLVYLNGKEYDLNSEVLINMCEKNDKYELFISTENSDKEDYINELRTMFAYEGMDITDTSRLKGILISIQRWYRSLPQVTRTFKLRPDYIGSQDYFNAIVKIRSLLQKADTNPYEVLFKDIPSLLGTESRYDETIQELKSVKLLLQSHLDNVLVQLVRDTLTIFESNKDDDLHHTLKSWYESQSEISKKGLFSTKVTELMNYIDKLDIYDDKEVVRKLAKITTGTYVENWTDNSPKEYIKILEEIKMEVEKIEDSQQDSGQLELSFIDSNGNKVNRCYERASKDKGNIMRNIIEEALEEFEDSVDVNDRVAILVEMLEKTLM